MWPTSAVSANRNTSHPKKNKKKLKKYQNTVTVQICTNKGAMARFHWSVVYSVPVPPGHVSPPSGAGSANEEFAKDFISVLSVFRLSGLFENAVWPNKPSNENQAEDHSQGPVQLASIQLWLTYTSFCSCFAMPIPNCTGPFTSTALQFEIHRKHSILKHRLCLSTPIKEKEMCRALAVPGSASACNVAWPLQMLSK